MNKVTLMGFIAFASTVSYLYLLKKSKDGDSSVDGIEIKINPEKLVDGALAMSNIHPTAKDGIRRVAQSAIQKYYGDYE